MKISQPWVTNFSGLTVDADIDMNSYGFTELGNITMVKNSGVQFLAALVANGDWNGESVLFTAGEEIAQFETVYLKNDGKVYKSKADSATTMPIKGIATALVAINTQGVFLIEGFIRKNAWDWTIGAMLYASDITAGAITSTIPDTSGDQIQPVGMAITADIAWFRPDLVLAEVT